MSDYEKVLAYLNERAEYIRGEWNGDESGVQEEQANAAEELQELLVRVDDIVKELDI